MFNSTSTSRRDHDNVKWLKLRSFLKFQRLQEKLLTTPESVNRRHARSSSEKRKRSTTSTLSVTRSLEPVDNWSVFSNIFGMGGGSSGGDTPSVSVSASPNSSYGVRGRPGCYRPSLLSLRSRRRKSIVGRGPRTACIDLSRPDNSTPNYPRPYTRYNAVYNTSTEFEGNTGPQQPSAYHQKQYEDSRPETIDHGFDPPRVPCCGMHANIAMHDRTMGSHLELSPSAVLELKLREPGLRSSTALPAELMTNLWEDYPPSAAGEHSEGSDTATLVEHDPTPPQSSDSGISLTSQQGIQNPYTLGCVSLPSQVPNTPPAKPGNLPDREPIIPHPGHGGRSSAEQASTEFKKPDSNEAPLHMHTTVRDEIIARGLIFFSACLSWMSPMFPC